MVETTYDKNLNDSNIFSRIVLSIYFFEHFCKMSFSEYLVLIFDNCQGLRLCELRTCGGCGT